MSKESKADAVSVSSMVDEFKGVKLGDERLDERCLKVVGQMSALPGASLPLILPNDSELTAGYRFFNNERVTPMALLEPHFLATAARSVGRSDLLVVHDTTEMAFKGAREGLGPLTKGEGFLAHVSLVVSLSSAPIPLGAVALEFVTREKTKKKKSRRAKYSFEGNEAVRWENGAKNADDKLRDAGTKPIHVMDREGDSYLLFTQMIEKNRRFVIRLTHNRVLDGGEGSPRKLADALADLPVLSEREASLSNRSSDRRPSAMKKHPPRVERTAKLVISATAVAFKRPHAAPKTRLPESLSVNIVRVHEPEPPAGEKAVEWMLVTSERIDSPEDAVRVVNIYRYRWLIEEFFKALKSGCAVEKREFDTADALQNIFAISVPMAWQMLLLRAVSRENEDAPATTVLTKTQLLIMMAATKKLPPRQRPPSNPTARQALIAIAAMGGHVSRNGGPGWAILARGFSKLLAMEEGFRLASLL